MKKGLNRGRGLRIAIGFVAFAIAGIFVRQYAGRPESRLVDQYEKSATHKALTELRRSQLDRPLQQAVFLGTHNSYNSKAYATFWRYHWPNQQYSITDQLRMDIRALSLDVHYTFGALRLCHGNSKHQLCSPADRRFEEGLAEIRHWLARPENQREVVIIELEEYLEGHNAEALAQIRHDLGPWIHQPTEACRAPDEWLTLRELTAPGPRVIITSKRCYEGEWGEWIFPSFGEPKYPKNKVKYFRGYPDCNFSRDFYDTHFVGFGEDSVSYGPFHSGPADTGLITPGIMRGLIHCGVNEISLDQVSPDDARLRAAALAIAR